ncbi:hypothetical protein V6N13_082431 [Hibiscus sabdariffa]|uniref:C2H2-type domain-containing protein n=1 Tax=Hibiscus sabdariffa TaxID=183260 RepID=A0ABR2Q3D5_9ROSI
MENEGETSDLRPSRPIKILKLKISKHCDQHVCPVCSKAFTSGKALGGHIRIHMNNNGRHRRISKPKRRISTKHADEAVNDEEDDEVVSCCVCNKEFKSMKSLFGHMRNHPERSWRGIRPPSDKNSCCSSVSEDDEAMEEQQVSFGSEENLVPAIPKWSRTVDQYNSEEKEVFEAAYCLMKMSRGDSFDLGQSSFGSCQAKLSPTDELPIAEPVEQEGDDLSAMEGFYPKNPSCQGTQFEAPANAASETLFHERSSGASEGSHQVCSHKMLDVDLNEPYVPVEHEGVWSM